MCAERRPSVKASNYMYYLLNSNAQQTQMHRKTCLRGGGGGGGGGFASKKGTDQSAHPKSCLPGFVINKGADQPAHLHRLISAVVIRILEIIVSKLAAVKPVLSGHSKRRPKLIFKTYYRLMQVKSIAECSKRSFCNTFNLH